MSDSPGQREVNLLGGKVVLRTDDTGEFDELLLMDDDKCRIHMEMMNDGCLWMGIHPKGEKDRVVVWVNAKGKKLDVRAEEE